MIIIHFYFQIIDEFGRNMIALTVENLLQQFINQKMTGKGRPCMYSCCQSTIIYFEDLSSNFSKNFDINGNNHFWLQVAVIGKLSMLLLVIYEFPQNVVSIFDLCSNNRPQSLMVRLIMNVNHVLQSN